MGAAGRVHPRLVRRGLLGLCGVGRWPGYVGLEQRAAYIGDVHDAGQAGVSHDRQVPETLARHDFRRVTDAGRGADDSRVGSHQLIDPDVVRVLPVRDRVRDVVRTRYVALELMEVVNDGLAARGLEIEDVWSGVEASRRVVDAMPSGDVAVSLLTEYHRDSTLKWKRNHIFDIDALSVAVPYCDAVVADGDAIDKLRRLDTGGFEDGRHDVDDVVELVAHAAGVLDAIRP